MAIFDVCLFSLSNNSIINMLNTSVVLVNLNFITNDNKFMVFLFCYSNYILTHTTEFYGQQITIKLYTPRVFRNRLNTKSITLTITYDYG